MAMSVVYSNFGGEIVHENRGGVERFYMPDTLGSTQAMIDTNGTVTDTFEYWSYGEERSHTGTSTTPFTWLGILGYFKDVLNKLYYVRARYMRPELARWQTVDPLWPEESAFGYVKFAPTFLADPSGLNPVCVAAAICAGAAIIAALIGCAGDPRGLGPCVMCWALSHPVAAGAIVGLCAGLIIACFPALAGWIAQIGRGLGIGGGALAPGLVYAAGGRANPACGTSCELQLGLCEASGIGGIPPCGRWYEPYCKNCYAQCVSSGTWPTYIPCDYWNWSDPNYDPTGE